jgi:hypothetical protein
MYKTVIFNFHCYVEDILKTLCTRTFIFRRDFEFSVPLSMISLIWIYKPRACGIWLKIRLYQLSFATFV